MSGKRILLCLDDLWEEQHETELNFVDVSAGSKVLISTRMKGLLAGGHQVEVGLPSVADSVRMLLAVAGVDAGEPTGVREVVGLCGRLPLALGIAGRLAASLGLVGTETQDWSDMIGVLKEELRESDGGAEEGMIRASLRGLKGSAQEQASVKALLNLFALVPEDTHAPLGMLLLMFKATSLTHDSEGTTIMHIRKWLRILLNRSLVLGTIDRPSVHDLVLDFAVAQHSADELREKHQCVVEAFRAARPSNAAGVTMYDYVNDGDSVTAYVINNAAHHAKGSHQTNNGSSEKVLLSWLHDQPKDLLCNAISAVLGEDTLQHAAEEAEAAGEMLPSACWWAAAATVQGSRPGLNSNLIAYYLRAWQALSKARLGGSDSALACSASQLDHLELIVTSTLLLYDFANLPEYMIVMERLLETVAGKARPDLYLNYYVSYNSYAAPPSVLPHSPV